jgi:hypothetical protein
MSGGKDDYRHGGRHKRHCRRYKNWWERKRCEKRRKYDDY